MFLRPTDLAKVIRSPRRLTLVDLVESLAACVLRNTWCLHMNLVWAKQHHKVSAQQSNKGMARALWSRVCSVILPPHSRIGDSFRVGFASSPKGPALYTTYTITGSVSGFTACKVRDCRYCYPPRGPNMHLDSDMNHRWPISVIKPQPYGYQNDSY